ncbi:hypothetical protein HRR78_004277 [Exophiala dermatitidis]|nr:hypothetical protein HRR75_005053 [Exophiala dermatitidis]KAJ4550508.1 hypothetical protein HRR78_004277 [Exophiala dermatitidis]
MGAGQSKPDVSTKHVFASDTPIQFSQELLDSLQASSETNSTRAKALELHIAQRVSEELEKVQKHESALLEEARKKIAEGEEKDSAKSSAKSSDSLLQIPSISPKNLLSSESDEEKQRRAQSSQKVQQEIEKLKQTLGQRKTLKELPKEVESAYVYDPIRQLWKIVYGDSELT